MRVTNNVLINNLKRNLGNNLRSLDNYQNQVASGKRINKPSDDPAGIVDSLRIRSKLSECKQYQSNASDAMSWLENSDEALGSLTDVLNRVYELTVYAASDTLEANERKAISEEVEQLIEEVGTIGNSTFGGRYIFGGSNTMHKPYEGGSWDNANTDSIEYEISVGVTIPVNITAQDVFLEKDMMGTLQGIYDHMRSGDALSLSETDIEDLQANIDQVLSLRSQVGSRVNRLEMITQRLLDQEVNLTKLQSGVEDIDLAKTILELKNQESVYQASLSVGAQIIRPTLVDFLN
jgi:flagellar hook-associated protein 3 FlgL